MKFGVPWSANGIRPEARETAKEAARRSGLSLSDWLNAVIIQQAKQESAQAPSTVGKASNGNDIAVVNERLDNLTQRFEQLARSGREANVPKRSRNESDQPASVTRPTPPPAMPNVQLPPSLDRAVAEIAARQRALNGYAAPPRQQPQAAMAVPAPPPAPAHTSAIEPAPTLAPSPAPVSLPAQDLSGLADQIRNITDRIETLRKPGIELAINALREELGEIARTLSDAMPRQAIDAIEKQIRDLNRRIAEGRQAGVGALGGIERGLAEVRDGLRKLTPAENLVGYNEAVAGLAHKIDLIVAQNDPATLAHFESANMTLREMITHVASNETVSGLAAQVHALGEKVEHMASAGAGGDALYRLEQRIAALSDAMAERAQHSAAVPSHLEALVESLTDKIEQIQNSRGNGDAFGHLEDHIVSLAEKLDASDSRLGQLGAIERGLADLLVHIEDLRANKDAGGLRAPGSPGVDDLKHDIARTQDALESVHGMLGHVVDRLAMIEKDIRGNARPPNAADSSAPLGQRVGKVAVRPGGDAPVTAAPMPELSPPALRRLAAIAQLPVDYDLQPDQPLEPGSGPPPMHTNPAARIAASEAALGGARPAAAPGGKSNFIAAARRAAQAAVQESSARAPRPQPTEAEEPESPSLRTKVMKRVKSLFIAASIIAVVVGLIQIAGKELNLRNSETQTAESPAAYTTETEAAAKSAAPEPTAGVATNPPALPIPPTTPPLASPSGSGGAAIMPPQALNQTTEAMPSLFDPPVPGSKADITGSISRPAASSPEARPAPASKQPDAPSANRLPIAIGGPRLRSAAIAGDGAAAYEVAVRYAEGRGVPANMEEAARWYERAASKGLTPAQFHYASLLEKGMGVKKDLARARRLYLAAAAKGNSKAMHNLAVLYAEGIDGKPDYGAAVQWFRKAAQRGIADSQYNLGVLCARGLGADKSYAEAYKWFALAAARGDKESAKKRDDIAAHMDADALAVARKAVTDFVAEPQPPEAVIVPQPPGGWDQATGTPPARVKAQPVGPLSLGAFQVGKQ
jgi:localization factor PodJL